MEGRSNVIVLACCVIAVLALIGTVSAADPTTSVHVVKYANDGTTILDEETVTYQWMETNRPVLGDGTTHYYHQGPVFVNNADDTIEQQLRWNEAEDTNLKDMGAVQGTNLKDLCDLVGGMNAGETVNIIAADGLSMTFAYKNVYEYSSREGPMAIAWNKNGLYPDETGYSEGMRLVWFADDDVFGNYDWHEAAASEYWYYYQSGNEKYPTTTGLSVQVVSEIRINSDDEKMLWFIEMSKSLLCAVSRLCWWKLPAI
jgi:hypothetical protein